MDNSTEATNSSPPQIEIPCSGAQLQKLIETLPEEQGLRLLREHWSLLLPKDPGIGLVGAYCRLLPRHTSASDTLPTPETE